MMRWPCGAAGFSSVIYLLTRYTLGIFCIYLGMTWAGYARPEVDFDFISASEGTVICFISGSRAGSGGAYKMNEAEYVDRFSRVFGWSGTGCDPRLNGRLARILWVPIPGERRRLFLRIEDIDGRMLSGVPMQKRVEIWKRDFDNKFALLLAKSMLIVAGVFIVFFEMISHILNGIRGYKNGSSKSS